MLLKMQAHARKTHRDNKIRKVIAENVKYLASVTEWNLEMWDDSCAFLGPPLNGS